MNLSCVRRLCVAFLMVVNAPTARADDLVTVSGTTKHGTFHYLLSGIETERDSLVAWPSVMKITNSAGKVIYEVGSSASGREGSRWDSGEVRGSLYVNDSLGLALDVPTNKDVSASVHKQEDWAKRQSAVMTAMDHHLLVLIEIALDVSLIKNKATAEMFQHRFPNRVFVFAEPCFAGFKADDLLRRIAVDEVKRYEEAWADFQGGSDSDKTIPPPTVDSVTIGGEKGFRARGSITEKRRGGVAAGKAGQSEAKRERVVEVTIVRHDEMLLELYVEVTAPDDLVDSLQMRLRKIVSSIKFQAPVKAK